MDALDRLNPEQRARVRIDEMLEAAGWVIQDYGEPAEHPRRPRASPSASS